MMKRFAANTGLSRAIWLLLTLLPGCVIVDEIAHRRDDGGAASGDVASSSTASGDVASTAVASSGAGGGDGDAGTGDGSDGQGGAGGSGGEGGASLSCHFDDVTHQLFCAGSPSGDDIYVHETWEYGFYPLPGYQNPAYFSQGPVNWYNCLAPAPTSSRQILIRYWLTWTNGTTTAPTQQWIDCQ